jgi:imidazolonepropionase-like amidohydrolase
MNRGLLILLAFSLLPGLASARPESNGVVVRGARLIDGTGRPPVENTVLVIERGRIRAVGASAAVRIPKGAKDIDLRGKTLMPALIDLHTHLGQTRNGLEAAPGSYTTENIRAQLERLLAYGVGTVVCLGTDDDLIYELRDEQRAVRQPTGGARFLTAGRGFGVAGGYPPATPASGNGDRYRPKTPQEARAEVRELARHRPDFVKMWVDDDFGRLPKMRPEIYRAIIAEAHRHKLRVVAHVFYLADAKALVDAGVDALGHSIRDLPVDRELIDALKARGVLYIPTLVRDESTFAYAEGPEWLRDPFFQAGLAPTVLATLESPQFKERFSANPDLARYRAAFEMGKRNLKTLMDAGVRIGFGTDAGPPLRFQGYFEHRELQLMVESGLSPLQAIVCATRNAGEFLAPLRAGYRVGTLELGKQADFLVLDADPLEDIRNTERLSAVWQAGEPRRPISAP